MKIIFLNIWSAKLRDPFMGFLNDHISDTDIFCFQEAYGDARKLMKKTLTGYQELATSKYLSNDDFQQAIYVKKEIPILSSGTMMEEDKDLGLGFYVETSFNNRSVHICNVHGISQPGHKLDTPERLRQSEVLIDFFKDKTGQKVIGGDFNILEKTASIEMFEKNGYRDLIKDFRTPTTRNHFAWDLFPGNEMYFSDYAFVSQDINIKKFSVPTLEVSDHLPLILEIDDAKPAIALQ